MQAWTVTSASQLVLKDCAASSRRCARGTSQERRTKTQDPRPTTHDTRPKNQVLWFRDSVLLWLRFRASVPPWRLADDAIASERLCFVQRAVGGANERIRVETGTVRARGADARRRADNPRSVLHGLRTDGGYNPLGDISCRA